MALAYSALSLAAEDILGRLNAEFPDFRTVVDSPASTSKTVDNPNAVDHLNVFFYRISPSPMHAAQTSQDPLFIRLHALLTPFPRKDPAVDHPHLKILGEVVRFFHQNPVSGVLQTPLGTAGTTYKLRAILQAPAMEELNHIWTTQGSELAYQLSAAYEFTLVPVDPAQPKPADGQVLTTLFEVGTDPAALPTPTGLAAGLSAVAGLDDPAAPGAPPVVYGGSRLLPNVLFAGAEGPGGTGTLAVGAQTLPLALAGDPGSRALITRRVLDATGAELAQAASHHPVATHRFDTSAAALSLPLALPAGAAMVVVDVRPCDPAGIPFEPQRIGNTLTLPVAAP